MTSMTDFSVQSGLEVSHLTAITHAVDDQKNRQQPQDRRRQRKKKTPPPPPEIVDDNLDADDETDQGDKPTVNYLA